MPSNRDDFNKETKRILQERVGNRCSNPEHRCLTSGPNFDSEKATRIGVAAHITAASERGPRFDHTISNKERSHISNGIWLCQNCAKLVDNDEKIYTVALLHEWKHISEENCRRELESKPPLVYPQKEGWSCGFCRSFVEHLQVVCTECNAEAAYAATRHERAEAGKAGAFLGVGLSAFLFLFLPELINSNLGWGLSIGLGLGGYAVFVTGALILVGSFVCVEIEERKYRGKPPRFFRKTNI